MESFGGEKKGQDSTPPPVNDIRTGSGNDLVIITNSDLNNNNNNNASVETCPLSCPSCGAEGEATKLASILTYFQRQGRFPPTQEDFAECMKYFGGSKAHSIVAQSVLRDLTRNLLTRFMDGLGLESAGERSPCIFEDDSHWSKFQSLYTKTVLEECSAPLDEAETAGWIKDKVGQAAKFRSNHDENLRLVAEWNKGGWGQKSKGATDRLANTGAEQVPGFDALTDGQKENFKKFVSRTPKGTSDAPTVFTIKVGDAQAVFEAVIQAEQPGKTVVHRKVADKEGNTKDYAAETFDGVKSLGVVSMLTGQARISKDEWVGKMFTEIMKKPFTHGSQCRYCEELQGNGSVIQRYEFYKTHGNVPEEFVGRQLLEELTKFKSAQDYVAQWMAEVSQELRERILHECRELRKKAGQEPKGQKADANKDKPPISDDDVQVAYDSVMPGIKNKYKITGFPPQACSGQVMSWLKEHRGEKQFDKEQLAASLKSKLDGDDSLAYDSKSNKYKPK